MPSRRRAVVAALAAVFAGSLAWRAVDLGDLNPVVPVACRADYGFKEARGNGLRHFEQCLVCGDADRADLAA
jgi:hypothetical protein